MAITCIITDDEPIARRGLERYLEQLADFQLLGVCSNALELDRFLSEQAVDLVFLDINMPYLSGVEFLKSNTHQSKFILTTAYPEYALEGYELDILDYLLKPISFERFFKATQKAKSYFQTVQADEPSFIFLKCDKRIEKIVFAEILFIESMQNYVRIHTKKQSLLAHTSLKSIKEQLPSTCFVQCHKSFIVNIQQVVAIEGMRLIIDKHKIPVSKGSKKLTFGKILNQ